MSFSLCLQQSLKQKSNQMNGTYTRTHMCSAVNMNHGEAAQIVALLYSQWAQKRYSESRLWLIFCPRFKASVPVFHHLPLKSNAHYFSIDSRGEIHAEYQHSRGVNMGPARDVLSEENKIQMQRDQ